MPNYYPSEKVNKILTERDKDGLAEDEPEVVREEKINPLTQSLPNEEEMQRLMLVIDEQPKQ